MAYRSPRKLANRMAARSRRAHADDDFARDVHPAARTGPRAGEGVSDPMAAGGLHERGRILFTVRAPTLSQSSILFPSLLHTVARSIE
jgi:hypothetical protein